MPPVEWASTHVAFPEISDWNTVWIKLERTPCYGMCPTYSIEIHGDGMVFFPGEDNVPARGRFRSRVSKETVSKLVDVFRQADYFSLKNEYAALITDNPACITSLSIDGHTMLVRDYVGFAAGMPQVVWRVEREIDQIARDKGWIH